MICRGDARIARRSLTPPGDACIAPTERMTETSRTPSTSRPAASRPAGLRAASDPASPRLPSDRQEAADGAEKPTGIARRGEGSQPGPSALPIEQPGVCRTVGGGGQIEGALDEGEIGQLAGQRGGPDV